MMARSIRFKLTFWYAATVGVIAVCLGFLLYVEFRNKLYEEIDLFLEEEAESVGSYLLTVGEPHNLQHYFAFMMQEREFVHYPNKFIQLVSAAGQVMEQSHTLEHTALPFTRQTLETALGGETVFTTARFADGTPLRLVMMPVQEKAGVNAVVELAIPLTETYRVLSRLEAILFLLLPIVLAISVIGGAYMATRALRPVYEITQAARTIEADHLGRRLQVVNAQDEIGQLAAVLNSLLARLDGAFQQRQQFTADAAHELRTPLTVLRCGMEVLAGKRRSPAQYQEALGAYIDEVSHLSRIVENLFTLARADTGKQEFAQEEVVLNSLLQEVYEQAEWMAEAKSVQLSLSANEVVAVRGDRLWLKRLLLNLVENAVKYTPTGGVVSLALDRAEHCARVIVEDSGIGIPAEALPHIFDRFYRADTARSLDEAGGGLGLSICQWIAHAHNGNIAVESRVGYGSTFIVSLPLA